MSRQCDLTGKNRQANHKVSHSNIKTRTFKQPNLKTKKVFDPESGQRVPHQIEEAAEISIGRQGLHTGLRDKGPSSHVE